MLRFLLTRASLVIPTFLGITLVAFFLIRLVPGDPIETMAGERGIDPARHAELRAEYGFDKPLLVQYGIYLERLAHGDLGRSISTKEPVIAEFASLFRRRSSSGCARSCSRSSSACRPASWRRSAATRSSTTG